LLDTTKTNSLSPSIRSTDHGYNEVRLEILLDISSIELFINDGEYVISSRIYLDGNYKLEKEGQVNLEINNLII
jgi:sucrose-6-phosphate hydrolase SacC (GH32 family)